MNSISATSVMTYKTCPLQWKYNYILHLLKKESKALQIGSLYHELLQDYHSKKEDAIIISKAEKVLNSDDFTLLMQMYNKYKEYPINGKVVDLEHNFNLQINGIPYPIIGFVDRIDEDKIVEYKTSSYDYKDEDTKTIQTDIYAYVLWKEFGKIRPVVYYVMNKKKAKQKKYIPQKIEIIKTEEDMIKLEKELFSFVDMIKNKQFESTPGNHCFWCPWGIKSGDGTCIYSK